MIIREATENDISSIVELLKKTLGESLMPKSEEYWRWKHIDNPFGPSPVLLAFEKEKLVGVRAFMRWEWRKGSHILRAMRAVDTATHPDYQGKGIFKKLTLELVEQCKQKGFDFIYNTPNQSSLPGYLKMGWEKVGSLLVGVSVNRPLNILKASIMKTANTEFLESGSHSFSLPENIKPLKGYNIWRTNYSKQYLTWRYREIPTIPYYSVEDDDTVLIFRIIRNTKGVELRVAETLCSVESMKKILLKLKKTVSFDFISITGEYSHLLPGLLKKSIQSGPKVTIRSLNYVGDDFFKFKSWSPSLGDLEVF